MKTYFKAMSVVDPPEFLSSLDIEKMIAPVYKSLKLSEGRLEFITGVKKRGYWPEPMKPSDIATLAAEKLFKDYNLKPESIDVLINASVCKDCEEPSTASFIHKNLKLRDNCKSFDLSNACLGVMNAIEVAKMYLHDKSIANILIVSGENSRDLLKDTIKVINKSNCTRKDLKKFIASFTIGSAGSAILISSDKFEALWEVGEIHSMSDTDSSNLCEGHSVDGVLLMETDSEQLLINGLKIAKDNYNKFSKVPFDKYILHQVGSTHRDKILKNLEIPEQRDFSIFQDFGNSGSSAIIVALEKAYQEKFVQENHSIGLLGIGSGLHTLMMELKPCN